MGDNKQGLDQRPAKHEQHSRKKARQDGGHHLLIEVGCRGFVATSTVRLMKDLGISGQVLRQAIKDLSRVAERCSQWLWLKRKDPSWSPK